MLCPAWPAWSEWTLAAGGPALLRAVSPCLGPSSLPHVSAVSSAGAPALPGHLIMPWSSPGSGCPFCPWPLSTGRNLYWRLSDGPSAGQAAGTGAAGSGHPGRGSWKCRDTPGQGLWEDPGGHGSRPPPREPLLQLRPSLSQETPVLCLLPGTRQLGPQLGPRSVPSPGGGGKVPPRFRFRHRLTPGGKAAGLRAGPPRAGCEAAHLCPFLGWRKRASATDLPTWLRTWSVWAGRREVVDGETASFGKGTSAGVGRGPAAGAPEPVALHRSPHCGWALPGGQAGPAQLLKRCHRGRGQLGRALLASSPRLSPRSRRLTCPSVSPEGGRPLTWREATHAPGLQGPGTRWSQPCPSGRFPPWWPPTVHAGGPGAKPRPLEAPS